MRFPWAFRRKTEDNSFCLPTHTNELQDIAIHRSFLCAQMAGLAILVESLNFGKVETDKGSYLRYPTISSKPKKDGLVAFVNDTNQKRTVRTEANNDSRKVNLALDSSFPLEVCYIKSEDFEEIKVNIDNHEYPLDEDLVMSALGKIKSVIQAKPIENPIYSGKINAQKQALRAANNVLRLVS